MAYNGSLNGVPFAAEKPIIVLSWPDRAMAKEFDTKWEALRFVAARVAEEDLKQPVRLYEFVASEWRQMPLAIC